jgi:hypothetical protein
MNVEIILDGKAYALHPTFKTLSCIEEMLSTSVMALAVKLAENTITLEEIAIIVTECLRTEIQESSVREALLRSGLAQATQAVTAMFVVIVGGPEAKELSRGELQDMATTFPD